MTTRREFLGAAAAVGAGLIGSKAMAKNEVPGGSLLLAGGTTTRPELDDKIYYTADMAVASGADEDCDQWEYVGQHLFGRAGVYESEPVVSAYTDERPSSSRGWRRNPDFTVKVAIPEKYGRKNPGRLAVYHNAADGEERLIFGVRSVTLWLSSAAIVHEGWPLVLEGWASLQVDSFKRDELFCPCRRSPVRYFIDKSYEAKQRVIPGHDLWLGMCAETSATCDENELRAISEATGWSSGLRLSADAQYPGPLLVEIPKLRLVLDYPDGRGLRFSLQDVLHDVLDPITYRARLGITILPTGIAYEGFSGLPAT